MADLLQACFCTCGHGTEMHRSGPCFHCPCPEYIDNGATKRLLDQLVRFSSISTKQKDDHMTTLADLAERTNVRLDDHLPLDEPLPIRTGMFAQGDLICIPLSITAPTGGVAIPASGIPVIRGNHDHVLTADPGVARWTQGAGGHELSIGVVTNSEPVFLLHAEHGGHCLAPGVWEMRGQRESAREGTRRVVD